MDFLLKVADFGFAAIQRDILQTYRGTQTYMAPEIKEGKKYAGDKVDIFSAGVILFILTMGIFPFKEAKVDENFYTFIHKKDYNGYWTAVSGTQLSAELKDLLQNIFAYVPSERPTLAQIRAHPWVNGPVHSQPEVKVFLMDQI